MSQIDISDKIRSAFSEESSEKTFPEKVILMLSSKAADFNLRNPKNKVLVSHLKEAYKRGVHDSIRLDKPSGTWALARVNMFLKSCNSIDVPTSYKKLDGDILNFSGFFIDDGIKEDLIFSYEEISEAKFDKDHFDLHNGDYSFVDLEEYSEANFPKEISSEEPKEEIKKFKDKEDKISLDSKVITEEDINKNGKSRNNTE
tara:strand:- start:1168 stop:1770 length:603 start_codon:yes stop_codon:yes gene_type:complete